MSMHGSVPASSGICNWRLRANAATPLDAYQHFKHGTLASTTTLVTVSDVEIRQAQAEDFPAVAAMHHPVWLESNSGVMTPYVLDLFAPPESWPDKRYALSLSTPGWQMWIAESDAQPVGMAIFGPDSENHHLIELDSLYVAREREGIGGRLLAKALESQPSADIILWCAEKNFRARSYYENRGFKLDGRSLIWTAMQGVEVPQLGYRLRRTPDSPE
jgi:GNAT superfamily N-acetyltransferase